MSDTPAMQDADWEEIGLIIDRLDNLGGGLVLPMKPELHLKALRALLPEITTQLKAFCSTRGFDPWSDGDE